jgi:acid phosphatase (class A)
MNPFRITIALLLFCAGPAFAKAPATYHYLAPDSVDVTSILPGPPAIGSAANKADIQAVLARQQSRTSRDIARTRSEQNLSPAAFSDVLGRWFTAQRLPLTFALLNNAAADGEAVSEAAKLRWNRPRPPLQDPSIHPVVTIPSTPSYPSGHSMRGTLWAVILAKMVPDRQNRLLARGAQIGQDRVIGGVHFPSDVAAGQKLGVKLAERFLGNPKFQRDLAHAEAEFFVARHQSAGWFSKSGIFFDPI